MGGTWEDTMPSPELVFVCEICQTILEPHLCKAICPNCGRMLDCSDLPGMAANARFYPEDETTTISPGSDLRDWMPSAAAVPEIQDDEDSNSTPEKIDDQPVDDLP